jgi:hypothetical protein
MAESDYVRQQFIGMLQIAHWLIGAVLCSIVNWVNGTYFCPTSHWGFGSEDCSIAQWVIRTELGPNRDSAQGKSAYPVASLETQSKTSRATMELAS